MGQFLPMCKNSFLIVAKSAPKRKALKKVNQFPRAACEKKLTAFFNFVILNAECNAVLPRN